MRKGTLIGAFFFILFSFVITLAQQVVITGKLTGCDGKPMVKGQVSVGLYKSGQIITSSEIQKDGSYQINVDKRGLVYLKFAGVNHRYKLVPLILDDSSTDFKLNVQLQTFQYKDDFNKLTFLDLSDPPIQPKTFEKQLDGTYLVEIEATKKHLEYGIKGAEQSYAFISGTQAEDYSYAGGLYTSGITVKDGKARIALDPKKLLHSDAKPQVNVETKDTHLAAFIHFYDSVDQQQTIFLDNTVDFVGKENRKELLKEYIDKNKTIEIQRANAIKARLNEEKDLLTRQMLLIEYFTCRTGTYKDLDMVKLALNEIPSSSILWSVETSWIVNLLEKCEPEQKEAYFNHFLTENKNTYTKSQVLLARIKLAKSNKNEDEVKIFYNTLTKDYPNTAASYEVKNLIPYLGILQAGNTIPEFSIISLEDSNKSISNNLLKGKYYLIDFWATWCGPCVGEMANLHKVYEKFKAKNFEILSISFDEKPEFVAKFRQQKWKMPWLNSVIEKGFDSDLAKHFEVTALPKPILVDPNGKIIATEEKLRGDELDKTLTGILSKTE